MQQKPIQDKVIDFPQMSDIDKQFLELERQKVLIGEQLERILGVKATFTDRETK